jgi:hypothetical protein
MGKTTGITIPSGKYIKLLPYGGPVVIHRWFGNNQPLFTVQAGATFDLDGAVTISGAGMPGTAVYVENTAYFGMSGAACVTTDNDVYLKNGAMITVTGTLSSPIIARITPEHPVPVGYVDTNQVLDGSIADLVTNCESFDVTPEDMSSVPDWDSPRIWRVDTDGELYSVVAKRIVTSLGEGPPLGTARYYATLPAAITASNYGSYTSPEAVYLVSNIPLALTDIISVSGHYVSLTVESGRNYWIKREGSGSASDPIFNVLAVLELGAPAGSSLIIDGGAVWFDSLLLTPVAGPAVPVTVGNSGVTSNAALVKVANTPGMFRLKSGAILRNNDRTATGPGTDGGAVDCAGGFEMTGGNIVNNRAASGGGAIYFYGNASEERIIKGGSITGNKAGLSGGAILFDYYQTVLAMSGGLINGNRASGLIGGISTTCLGNGGAVFIPSYTSSYTPNNEFRMSGTAEIRDNYSDSLIGNGIVIDTMWWLRPNFSMRDQAYVNPAFGDDIYLSRNSGYERALITIAGNLTRHTTTNRALVTFDNPLYEAAHPYPPGSQILNGLAAYYNRFNAVGHSINVSGILIP